MRSTFHSRPHVRKRLSCANGYDRLRDYCEQVGFYKEREVSFPHKQSNLMKIRREAWTAPAL